MRRGSIFLLAFLCITCSLMEPSRAEKGRASLNPFVFKFDVSRIIEKMPPLLKRLLLPKAVQQFEKRSGESNDSPLPIDDADLIEKNVTSSEQQDGVEVPVPEDEVKVDINGTAGDQQGESKTEITENDSALEEKPPTLWERLFGVPSPLAIIRGDAPANKQIFDFGDLPNLLDVLRRGGLDIDLTNQRVTIDMTLLFTEGVIFSVPIIITALIMGYFWIVYGLVEFDYTVFGQYPKLEEPTYTNTKGGYYKRMDVIKETFNMFKHAYNKYSRGGPTVADGGYENKPGVSYFPGSEMPGKSPVYVPTKKGDKNSRNKYRLPAGPPEGFFDVNDNTVKRRRLRTNK